MLAAVLLWSTVSVGTRILVRDQSAFSVEFIATVRLAVAAVVFLGVRAAYTRSIRELFDFPHRAIGWLFIAAAGIALNYFLYNLGLRYTSAAVTSVISPLSSVVTVLLAATLLHERLTTRKILGMTLATLGVLIVVLFGKSTSGAFTGGNLYGNLLEVAAALVWPLYAVGQTKLLQHSTTRQALMPIFAVATLFSLLLAPLNRTPWIYSPTPFDWGALFFLSIFSTAAAYWLFALALQRLETSEGAMFNVLIPPFAMLFAYLILGEPLHGQVIFGLALVVSGLLLIAYHRYQGLTNRRG